MTTREQLHELAGTGHPAAHPPIRLILCFLQQHSYPIIGFLPPICCRFVQLSIRHAQAWDNSEKMATSYGRRMNGVHESRIATVRTRSSHREVTSPVHCSVVKFGIVDECAERV